jgi:meso-butanediol dehydrogenase / (S,S)-butanediol dehydrogenase / diacetyl reductase
MRYEDSVELDGVRAVVTGAGGGLGRGLARSIAQRGASVFICDIDEEGISSALEELKRIGARAAGEVVDVRAETSIGNGLAAACDAFGGIDLLVNNAGVLSVDACVDLDVSAWARTIDVNATGVFLVSRAGARIMSRQGTPASIISISSVAGKMGYAGLGHYSASKFAVVGFSQSLARELARLDITVNVICPGIVETGMLAAMNEAMGTTMDELLEDQLIKRPQTPNEIAAGVCFLHKCRSVTGQAINIDGGTVFH